jgi:Xaa-Pro dipeptidase
VSFSQGELAARRERAVARLEQEGLDALVISLKEHLTYLTGFVFADLQQPAVGVLRADGTLAVWLTEATLPALEEQRAGLAEDVEPIALADELADVVAEALSSDASRVGCEGDWYALSWSERERMRERTVGVEWQEATHLLTELRLVKSAEEVAVLRAAAALADAGMEAALEVAAAGVREVDLAAAAQRRMAAAGSEYSSFPGLIGSGPRSGLYHPLASTRRLRAGDAVEIEVTGAVRRYNSNLVRTVFVTEPSAEQRALYEIVREAFEAGVAAVEPGRPVGEVDEITRRVRERYADCIPSRAGYGVELSYPPFLTGALSILAGAPHAFEPGMVFSLEPSIAGYREQTTILGCNVLVTADGAEILHRHTRELVVVP